MEIALCVRVSVCVCVCVCVCVRACMAIYPAFFVFFFACEHMTERTKEEIDRIWKFPTGTFEFVQLHYKKKMFSRFHFVSLSTNHPHWREAIFCLPISGSHSVFFRSLHLSSLCSQTSALRHSLTKTLSFCC